MNYELIQINCLLPLKGYAIRNTKDQVKIKFFLPATCICSSILENWVQGVQLIDSFIDFITNIQLLGLFSSLNPEIYFDIEYSRHVFTHTCQMNSSNNGFVKLFRCLEITVQSSKPDKRQCNTRIILTRVLFKIFDQSGWKA